MIGQAPRRDEPEPLQTAHAEDLVHLGEQETGSGVDSYSGEDGGERLTRVTPYLTHGIQLRVRVRISGCEKRHQTVEKGEK